MFLFNTIQIFLIKNLLAFWCIQEINTLCVSFLNLTTYHLHGTINHLVLFSERFRQYSEGTWQPTFWEHAFKITTLLILVQFLFQLLERILTAFFAIQCQVLE